MRQLNTCTVPGHIICLLSTKYSFYLGKLFPKYLRQQHPHLKLERASSEEFVRMQVLENRFAIDLLFAVEMIYVNIIATKQS